VVIGKRFGLGEELSDEEIASQDLR
jgi:hypothetical protein